MSTILLTSSGYFVTDGDYEISDRPREQLKWAYITTAAKGKDLPDLSYVEVRKKRFEELGYDYEEIDIDGKNQDELRNILSHKDVVYVEGGNTFYLLRSVRQSGFDKVIKDLVKNDMVYIGSSAGSYLACPTIEMSTWKLSGKKVKENYGLTDLTGLNLVPFLLKAHYKPEVQNELKEIAKNLVWPLKVITDHQALLVKDGKIEFLGQGPEIKI